MTEDKLKEIFDICWKGFLSFDEYSPTEKGQFKKEYSPEEFYNALKIAYNAGIEIAAGYVEQNSPIEEDSTREYNVIDEDSILNLQIK